MFHDEINAGVNCATCMCDGGACDAHSRLVRSGDGRVDILTVYVDEVEDSKTTGLVRITSWRPNFNGSHFGLPPSEIHRMTGLPPKFV